MALTPRERAERRIQTMLPVRKPYEPDWDEIARLCSASRPESLGTALTSTTPGPRKRRANMGSHTSKGSRAARILRNGMTSGLSSPSNPWFKLKTPDPDMMEFQPVKEWLAVVEKTLYDFLGATNFYNASTVGYAELGKYGTECGIMVDHAQYGAVTHTLTAGSYWIANDDGLMADTLVRRDFFTVHQMVESFVRQSGWGVVSRAVKTAYDNGRYEEYVPVWHITERNLDADDSKLDARNMKYRSIYWEEGQSNKDVLLRRSGFEEKPFWAPRWIEEGGSFVYGDGPGYEALPDLRNLHLASKRRGRNVDMLNRPPLGVPSTMQTNFLTLDPGSMLFGAPGDLAALKPIFEPQWQAVQVSREEVADHHKDVMECFYADLFFAITEMDGVQPRNQEELMLRQEEKLTQLGPVVERVNVEKLEVVIDRAFAICLRKGLIPPAPRELQGMPLRVDFISVLAQAQKAARLGDISRTAQFVGFLAGLYPSAADKFDPDEAIDQFATGAGTPPSIIRTDEIVATIREKQAQQKQMETMAALAAPAADGAKAAQLLSQTNVGGQNVLERAVG